MTLAEIARRIGCDLHGDGSVVIESLAPIESAGPGQLTFLAHPRYARFLGTTRAAAIVLARDAAATSKPSLRADDPYRAFAKALELFYRAPEFSAGIHATVVMAATARVALDAAIGPYVVIGPRTTIGEGARIAAHVVIAEDVTIGRNFTAHSFVNVRERTLIGDNVSLQSGAKIGGDGFGYTLGDDGRIMKIPQGGRVVIEDDVEIGANTTVDRAAVGETTVRRGAKLDNLVMIAHGCDVGAGSMLAAQVGLSGSTTVGQYVRMGGQVGCAGHLTIGDGAQIAAKSGVPNDVEPGATVGGIPAVDMHLWRRVSAGLLRLPELLRRLRRIERQLGIAPRSDAESR
ncbi:MAG TPA: UDP-3-O-(3-hydroxymyristoyl)glucosamine N-acyltransferase [Candidatus Kryptonia bacterium]|nr:UDP-3-O-(3-hydroxymyristoyl)glucosamine N-acyltransferase [Candidatus Kryptonia bacterium]